MTPVLPVDDVREQGGGEVRGQSDTLRALLVRVRGEYQEMPGLRLTVRQAARLFDMPADVADAVLEGLQRASVLSLSSDGTYALLAEPSRGRKAMTAPGHGAEE